MTDELLSTIQDIARAGAGKAAQRVLSAAEAEAEWWQEQEGADCLSPKGDAAWQEGR